MPLNFLNNGFFHGVLSITSDGSNAATLTESESGDFTIASVDDLRLDSGGNDIVLRGASSSEFGRLSNDSQNFEIKNTIADKDINIIGKDGASTITALSLDMSDSGWATFNSGVNWSGGSSTESNTAYDNMITGFSDSGTSTVTLTLTQQDAGTLTTSFSVPQGTMSSWEVQSDSGAGAAADVTDGDTVTFTSGDSSLDITNSGTSISFNLAAGAAGVTSVATTSPIEGGTITSTGTISHASATDTETTSSATLSHGGTFTALTTVTPNATGHVIGHNLKTYTLPADAGGTVTSVTVAAGALIDVSGDTTITTSGTVTVGVDLSELTDMTATMVGTDEFVVLDSSAQRRKAANEIGLSIFSNDSGFTSNTGTVTSITVGAGSGLTGGGTITTSGTVTLNVGAGNLIDVSADAVDVDLSELSTTTDSGNADFFAITNSASAQYKIAPGDIDLSTMNNDSGWTSNTGDITNVGTTSPIGGGGSSGSVTITHDSQSDTQTLASETLAHDGSFTAYTSVTTNATGHVSAHTLKTYTLPSAGSYTLPTATLTVLGGVKLGSNTDQTVAGNTVSSTASRSYKVQLNSSDQMLVNVPWTDTSGGTMSSWKIGSTTGTDQSVANTQTVDVVGGTGISGVVGGTRTVTLTLDNTAVSAGSYTHTALTVDAQGRITAASSGSDTTYSMMTSTTLGLGKLEDDTTQTVAASTVSTTASRTYGIQKNSSNQLVVNVPWSDTNTTYSCMTTSTLGLGKLRYSTGSTPAAQTQTTTASRTYGVTSNASCQLVVNVPWVDTTTGGTVTSITATTDGTALTTSNTITGAGTVTLPWQGTTAQYVNGEGDLVALSTLPQGDITGITTAANSGLAGGTTSGTATLTLDVENLTTTTDSSNADWFAISNTAGTTYKMAPGDFDLSSANNDSGWTSNAGVVTTLTTTGTSGAATLVGATLNIPNYADDAGVTAVTATLPVESSEGTTPDISMAAATTSVNGYLTSTDWTTFNNKGSGDGIVESLTTTGTSGASTLAGGVLNVPTYANTTYVAATATTLGLMKLEDNTEQTVAAQAVSATASRTYGIQFNSSDQAVVNVPWTDNDSGGTVTSVAALTLGTTGADLSSTVVDGTGEAVITLQVPTASASNRGALSSADWTTFNNKGSGDGNVSNSGVPLIREIAEWTDNTTIKGSDVLKINATADGLNIFGLTSGTGEGAANVLALYKNDATGDPSISFHLTAEDDDPERNQIWSKTDDTTGELGFALGISSGGSYQNQLILKRGTGVLLPVVSEIDADDDKFLMLDDDDVVTYVTGANLKSYIGAGTGDGTITSVTAGNYLNGGGSSAGVTVNHDTTSRSDTSSSTSPGSAGTFTAVDSVTTGSYGHITALNLKTVTMPTSTANTGTVTGVTATAPIVSSGGTAPVISVTTAAIINGGTSLATGDQIYDFVHEANDFYLNLAGGTMTGDIVLADDGGIQLDTSLASGASGTIIKIHSKTTVAGRCYILLSSGGGTWDDADATDESFSNGLLAIAVGTSATSDGMLTNGVFYDSGHGFTIGHPLYLSVDSPGELQNGAPTEQDEIARVVGYAIDTDEIYFCPDNTWVVLS